MVLKETRSVRAGYVAAGGAAAWTEVPNVPYSGPRPKLPAKLLGARLLPQVREWWNVVTTMPHCVFWEAADWLFVLDTLQLKQHFYVGESSVAGQVEMRRREDQIGTTVEARRKLRIRYVDPPADTQPAASPDGASVARLDDRRRRLAQGGDLDAS